MKKWLALLFTAIITPAHAVSIEAGEEKVDITFGGYAKLDMIMDFGGHRDKNQFLVRAIPVEGDPDYGAEGYFNMHGKETRFNMNIQRDTEGGEVEKFFIEMDFYGEDSLSPRLRHAYFQYHDFIVGRYWTNVSDLHAIPYFIDFAYGEGLYGNRRQQIRWQPQLSEHWQLGLSIEQPETTNIDNPLNFSGEEVAKLPVFSSRITYQDPIKHLSISAEFGQLYWDGMGGVEDDSDFAWVILLSGSYKLKEYGEFKAAVTHGAGTAKGILGLAAERSSATIDINGKIENDVANTVGASYTHYISPDINTTLGYAWVKVDPSTYREATDLKGSGIGHVNVLWQATKAVDMGLEYIWGTRRDIDQLKGDGTRLQAMVRYSF